jgi:predicted oxidoreductase
MTAWTSVELNKIGQTEELQIASLRSDGTLRKPVIIWVVRLGDELATSRYAQQDNLTTVERVSELAETRGLPMAQVALAWMLSKPVVTAPIIGATKPHHLEDAIAALSIQRLEEPYRPHPIIVHS